MESVLASRSHFLLTSIQARVEKMAEIFAPFFFKFFFNLIFQKIQFSNGAIFFNPNPSTFSSLRCLLEQYEPSDEPISPFVDAEHQDYVFYETLNILKSHLSVAKSAQLTATDTLGDEATYLRSFLFASLDKVFSSEIEKAIEACVTIGAQLLMPDMAGRTEVLLKLLPSSRDELRAMSRGKRTQLEIILRSLESSEGMPLLLDMRDDEKRGKQLCKDFLTALLGAWEHLDELRHLTHALLKQALLHLTAQLEKQVKLFLLNIQQMQVKFQIWFGNYLACNIATDLLQGMQTILQLQ